MDKFRLTECQTLDIPVGNDVPLLVKLVKGFDGCDGEGAVPFPIDVCENVVVAMVSERGQVKSVAHRLGSDGKVLLELQAADYRAGLTYGIDVRATLNGKAVHAYGKSLVRITAATERGPRQVAQAADPYEVTLQVGYVGDVIPHRLDELEGYDVLMDEVDGKADAAEVDKALEAVGREFQKYIPVAQKAVAGGVASLNGEKKVPTAQIPDLPYIPSNKKGAANGVAELDANRKVFNDQLYFAPRGTTTAAAMAGELEAGLYLVNGFKVSDDVLDGDGANGFLLQGTGASRGQLLVVGRAATGDERELTEVYSRRYLPTPKRWTQWSKPAGDGMAEVPPTILPNPMVKTSEGVYEFTAEVGKLYDLEKWDDLADVLRVHLPTPSDPSRAWKICFIVQDNMQNSDWTNSEIVFMDGNREIINVQQLFSKYRQGGWQNGPWEHSYPQMILFKWVGRQWVVESFTNDVLYPFSYSLVREGDYLVMKGSNGKNDRVFCANYSMMSGAEANAGTSIRDRVITASVLKQAILYHTRDLVNGGAYNSQKKKIELKHGSTVVAEIDAAPFIVDGMVEDVRIENGSLVIDFNTESGKQDIAIPLTDIFDPSNYYTKQQTDDLLSGKASTEDVNALQQQVAGKQDAIQDLAEIRSGAAAGATAVQPAALQPYAKKADTLAQFKVGEEVLIGEWTEDGVTYDLYRKVVSFGNLPNAGQKTVAHGISNKVKFVGVSAMASNGFPIPFPTQDTGKNIYVALGNNLITINTHATDRSALTADVTILFTRNKPV